MFVVFRECSSSSSTGGTTESSLIRAYYLGTAYDWAQQAICVLYYIVQYYTGAMLIEHMNATALEKRRR
jgi:hypothetical protein